MRSNIGSILTKRAHMNPDNEALFDVAANKRFNYAELNARTNQVVNALTPHVKKGDRVALLMMNSHEFISAFFAIAKMGAVVVPLNWRLVPDELEFILKDSGSTVLFYGEEFLPSVAELHARGDKTDINVWIHTGSDATKPPFAKGFNELVDPAPSTEPEITAFDDDMLYIMYTSGTTGLPKGVMHTHTTQMEALITLNATSDFCIGDRYLNPMPLFHVGALTPAIVGAYRGLAHILMRAFDPVKVWELVRDEKINNALLVPAMLGAC
ncbi:MAG: AMP-binding protein, partial [Acidimicrobiaceae bacterium]